MFDIRLFYGKKQTFLLTIPPPRRFTEKWLALPDNPSVTADAVPPPFTQGRLWLDAKFEQTHFFDALTNVSPRVGRRWA